MENDSTNLWDFLSSKNLLPAELISSGNISPQLETGELIRKIFQTAEISFQKLDAAICEYYRISPLNNPPDPLKTAELINQHKMWNLAESLNIIPVRETDSEFIIAGFRPPSQEDDNIELPRLGKTIIFHYLDPLAVDDLLLEVKLTGKLAVDVSAEINSEIPPPPPPPQQPPPPQPPQQQSEVKASPADSKSDNYTPVPLAPDPEIDSELSSREISTAEISNFDISQPKIEKASKDELSQIIKNLQREFPEGTATRLDGTSQPAEELKPGRDGLSDRTSVVTLINRLVIDAMEMRASDIHLEAFETFSRFRLRIDGELQDYCQVPQSTHEPLVARFKVLADLDITERMVPQDGRFRFKISGDTTDFRISVLPSAFGQNVVIRVLNRNLAPLDLNELGLTAHQLKIFRKSISRPYGMILVTGPTGSGKTTSLYAALMHRNTNNVKIITIEDPIEFQLPGINQLPVQLNRNDPERSLTFAKGLRATLRQDPDIILVGEIRDNETVQIAINASLTGHLVFSTVHANRAADVVSRLRSLDVEPLEFVDSLLVIMAQRLIRVICPNCKVPDRLTRERLEELDLPEKLLERIDGTAFKGSGCSNCNNSGYHGREGIFEILPVTDNIKDAIMQNPAAFNLARAANAEGMVSIIDNCCQKIKDGYTTLDELKKIYSS